MADMGRRWLEKNGYKTRSDSASPEHTLNDRPSSSSSGLPSGPGPLAGVKIIDLTRYQNGPSATRRLADYGADVIKIEHPDGGDQGRGLIFTPDKFDVFFEAFNRGKRSLCLDLRNEESKVIMHKLAQWADVLAENFRFLLKHQCVSPSALNIIVAGRGCCHRGDSVMKTLKM